MGSLGDSLFLDKGGRPNVGGVEGVDRVVPVPDCFTVGVDMCVAGGRGSDRRHWSRRRRE